MKKANPDGQGNRLDGERLPQNLIEEIQIFKDKQNTEIKNGGKCRDHPRDSATIPVKLNQHARKPVQKYESDHDQDEHRLSPGIEDQACDQQKQILEKPFISKQHIIAEQHGRKEQIYECDA